MILLDALRQTKLGYSGLIRVTVIAAVFLAAIVVALEPRLTSAQQPSIIDIQISETIGILELSESTPATEIVLRETLGVSGVSESTPSTVIVLRETVGITESAMPESDAILALARTPEPTESRGFIPGVAPQVGNGEIIGRGFVGNIIEVGKSSLTIESKGVIFRLSVTGDTVINNPPDLNVGLAGLQVDSFFRVAGSVDASVTDQDGILNPGTLNAQMISVIPGKATRTHKRTFIAEKKGDALTILDSDGKKSEVAESGGDFQQGDNLVLLVRSGGKDGKDQVKGLFNAKRVDVRLEKFVNDSTSDASKNSRMKALRDDRDQSLEAQLNSMAGKSGDEFGQMVRDAAHRLNDRRADRNAKSGSGRVSLNTEPIPVTGGDKDDTPPRVSITSPESGAIASVGGTIIIKVDAEDDVTVVSLEISANGVLLATIVDVVGFTGLEYPIPGGVSTLAIEVTATDSSGQTATDTRRLILGPSDSPPSVKIISPTAGTAVEEGSTLRVEMSIEDDGEVVDSKTNWPIVGDLAKGAPENNIWVSETIVPILSKPNTTVSNNVLPHIFVGDVTIDGKVAPDGTVVSAWVAGAPSSKIVLEAIAIDDGGNTTVTSVSLELLARQVKISETTVSDGSYSLLVGALQGQSFVGRVVNFRVNGVVAVGTGIWVQGGADATPIGIVGPSD